MHHKQLGFTENKLTYVVEEQRGRIFKGYKTLTMLHDQSKRKEGLAGVITKDSKAFYLTDHIGGLEFSKIDSGDKLTIYCIESGGEISKAGILELTKQRK